MDRYIFDFLDYEGHKVKVSIFDTGSTTSDEFVLNASEEPVIIEQTDDDDLMCPIRYTYARIKVIANYHIFSIINDYNLRVVITVDDSVEWTGRIEPQAFSQELDDKNDEIELNAIDDLGYACMQKINIKDGAATISFIDILDQALEYGRILMGDEKFLYIGNCFPYTISYSYTLNFFTSVSNWIENKEGRISTKKVEDFLTDWMRWVGCTLESDGKDWYIRTINDTIYSRTGTKSREEIEGARKSLVVEVSNIEDMQSTGTNTIEMIPQYGSVEMQSGGDELSNAMPKLDKDECDVLYCGILDAVNEKGNVIGWRGASLLPTNTNIKLHRYKLEIDSAGDPVFTPIENFFDTNKKNPFYDGAGAIFLYHDYYDTGNQNDKGSGSTSEEKVNWQFSERLAFVQYDNGISVQFGRTIEKTFTEGDIDVKTQMCAYIDEKFPSYISIESNAPVIRGKKQYLCINMNVFGECDQKFEQSWYRACPVRQLYNRATHVALRIESTDGRYAVIRDQYGQLIWVLKSTISKENPHTVLLELEEREKSFDFKKLVTNKKLLMNFDGDGLCIENLYTHFIKVEICGVFRVLNEKNKTTLTAAELAFIEELSLDIKQQQTVENIIKNTGTTRTQHTDGKIEGEEYSFSTSLSTPDEVLINRGTVYFGSWQPTTRLFIPYDLHDKFRNAEEVAMARAEKLMLSKSTILTLEHSGPPAMRICDSTNKIIGTRLAFISKDLRKYCSTVKYVQK